MLTPRAILDHAQIGEPYSLTAKGELLFKSGSVKFARLFRISLAKPGRLNKYGTVVVDVMFSHRSPISPTTDMDPYVMLSDGTSSVGFVISDKDNYGNYPPFSAAEGLSGPILHYQSETSGDFRVTSDPATVNTLHFRLEPHRPADCFAHGSYDREVSHYHQYSKTLYPERGLYVDVYRNHAPEQFLFSVFKIRAQVEYFLD